MCLFLNKILWSNINCIIYLKIYRKQRIKCLPTTMLSLQVGIQLPLVPAGSGAGTPDVGSDKPANRMGQERRSVCYSGAGD